MPDSPRQKDRSARAAIIAAAIAAAATVLVGLIPVVSQMVAPDPATPPSAPVSQPTAPALDPAKAVVCTPVIDEPVTVESVKPTDTEPGIGGQIAVTVRINQPAAGGQYWLMTRLPVDPRPIEVARRRLSDETTQVLRLSLASGPGSARTFYVARAAPEAVGWFEDNLAHDGDSTWDENRIELPPGADVASNSCAMTRTR